MVYPNIWFEDIIDFYDKLLVYKDNFYFIINKKDVYIINENLIFSDFDYISNTKFYILKSENIKTILLAKNFNNYSFKLYNFKLTLDAVYTY